MRWETLLGWLAVAGWILWVAWDAKKSLNELYGGLYDWEAVEDQRKATRIQLRHREPTAIIETVDLDKGR